MATMRLLGIALFVAIVWPFFSASLQAQRLAVTSSLFLTPTMLEVVNLATGMVESREQKAVEGPAFFSSNGRYLLLRVSVTGAPSLEVRDLATGGRTSITTIFVPRFAHPRRLAVYGLAGSVLTRLDAAGSMPYFACRGSLLRDFGLTVDGSRLAVLCQSGVVEFLDESTAADLGSFSIGSAQTFGFTINADGSRVLVARSGASGEAELALYEAASGAEILSAPMPGGPPPAPFSGPGIRSLVSVTPSRDAVIVTGLWSFDHQPGPLIFHRKTHLVDFNTLVPRSELAVPYNLHSLTISPDGLRAIVASNDIRPGAAIQDLDLQTGQPRAQVNIFGIAYVGGVFPPLPPTLPPATVNGQQVTITWSLPAHSPPADRFVLHAGSRSGASDLGEIDLGGNTTSFTANGVPPGRYFIRMTAVNFTGTSSHSSEIVVDVPAPAVQ